MAVVHERGSSSRAVLAAIVADPEFGTRALSHPATLFSLFCDYLPDAPRETGPLLAAAQVDVPQLLREHLDRGLTRPTAIQLAASSMAARTTFSDEECLWAAAEFALAIGLATSTDLLALPPPEDLAATSPDDLAAGGLSILPAGHSREPDRPDSRRRRSRDPRVWLAVIVSGALVGILAAIGIATAMTSQHQLAGQHPPSRSSSRSPAGGRTASASPGRAGGVGSPLTSSNSASRPASAAPSPRPSAPSPSTSPVIAPPPDPTQVASAYITAVNNRDWPYAWQLGGGNIVLTYQQPSGPLSYSQLVASFEHTISVTITSLTSTGDDVTVHVSALDSAGVTQYYQLNLVVTGGRIISGSQYFVGP